MTIRNYLFALISGLVLIIAATQVVLLLQFKNKIEDEIHQRGKDYADKILKVTLDSYDNEPVIIDKDVVGHDKVWVHSKDVIHPVVTVLVFDNNKREMFNRTFPLSILNNDKKLRKYLGKLPPNVKKDIKSLVTQLETQDGTTVELKSPNYVINITQHEALVNNKLIRTHLKKQIEKIKGQTYQQQIEVITTEKPTSFFFPRNHKKHSLINTMFNYITLIIVVTVLLSLFLVYYLSHKFSRPLQNLALGFKNLEKGNFGYTVPVNGVQEVVQTIDSFNNMSEKLKRLSEVEAKLQQQQHLQEIGDVSKGIAHALRNPLHTIGLAIEQLNDDQVSEKLKSKLIARVQSKIKQLDKSIKALLLITEGNFERNQQINVQTVINDVILELRQSHHIEERKLNIQVDVVDDLLITGSENEFRTLIHTLIFNSYDACESKDEITIEIKASLENGQLVIYINDFGSGLSDSIQQGLFTPHNSSKAEGAGMGLYISKRIVELYYDGILTIANKNPETPSEGAIATLTIPCNKGE